jgi:polysaccharide pyruvyl transferase WcaK-like protein
MDRQKVNVLGWYEHQNIGDDSYRLTFPLLFPNSSFNFLDKLDKPLKSCILGGGDVFGGYFLEHIQQSENKIALSVSIPENATKKQLEQFQTIIVRDSYSASIASSFNKEVFLYPDFSFALTPNKIAGNNYITEAFTKNNLDLYQKRIGIVINGNLIPNLDTPANQYEAFESVCLALTEVIDTVNASFIFIPFCQSLPGDDIVANGYVAAKCKYFKKNLFIKEQLSVQNTLDVISACDIVISTRLHSSIFSVISGVPFIDILHNHKNAHFLNDLCYYRSMSFWDFSKSELKKQINNIEQNYQDISEELQGITSKNKAKLRGIADNVSFV